MFRTRLFAFVMAGIVAFLSAGCLLTVEPETAQNPVGTEHTVIATLLDPESIEEEEFCENLFEEIEDLEPEDLEDEDLEELLLIFGLLCEGQIEGDSNPIGPADHNLVNFEIVSGPNAGLHSDTSGVCSPSCDEPNEDLEVSWTYQSNGTAGTDVIEVCFEEIEGIPEELGGNDLLAEILVNVLNETLGGDYYDSFEDFFCQTVEKTWIENTPTPQPQNTAAPSRPNIAAGLSGLFAGQPTALPTAPAPAAVAPSTTIRPPSTGDGGLR